MDRVYSYGRIANVSLDAWNLPLPLQVSAYGQDFTLTSNSTHAADEHAGEARVGALLDALDQLSALL